MADKNYENKVDALAIDKSPGQGGLLTIANFEEADNLRSALLVFVEIQSSDKDNQEIARILTEDLRDNFKNSPTDSLELAFEDALSKTNMRLKDILAAKPKNWLNKMHLLVLAIKDRDIHLSAVGEVRAFFVHREKMLDILGGGQSKIINPLKLFSNVTSGSITSGQSLAIINEPILDYISPERIRKTANDYSPAQATAKFAELLDRAPANKKFGVIFIKRIRRETPQASAFLSAAPENAPAEKKAKTKAEAIEKIYAAPVGQMALPTSAKETALAWLAETVKFLASAARKTAAFALNYLSLFLEKTQQFLRFILDKGPNLPKLLKSLVFNPEARKYYLAKLAEFARRLFLDKVLLLKNKFLGLPKRRRRLAAAISALCLVLVISLIYKINAREDKLAQAQFAAQTAEIEQKLSQSEASLIYQDTARARTLIGEINELLKNFPRGKKEQQEKYSELNSKAADLLNKLENRKIISNLTLTAELPGDWQNQEGEIKTWGKEIVYLNPASDKIARILENQEPGAAPANLNIAADFAEAVVTDEKNIVLLSPNKATLVNAAGQASEEETFNFTGRQSSQRYAGYGSNIYLLDAQAGAITRFRKTTRGFSGGQNWLKQNQDLASALSLAVDGKIYLLEKENRILVFANGQESGVLEMPLSEAIGDDASLYTDAAINNLYIFDPANKRIIAMEKNGKTPRQYKIESGPPAESFAILADEKTGFMLAENKIYRFALE